MKNIIFLYIFITLCTASLAQSSIQGLIVDKESNESVPFATIKIIGTQTYTISNEDGKFEINPKYIKDSLEVSCMGFQSKKVAAFYFKENNKLYLDPQISMLDEVMLFGKKDEAYAYTVLNKLIDKYREKKKTTKSKAFLTLTSSARSVPIEQIEGFYNSEQNQANGLISLELKSGRFGQNKSFPFYSLDNTEILRTFQPFETSKQILPEYPGNMTEYEVKRKYTVKIEACDDCQQDEIRISFFPKKSNGRLFSGKITMDHQDLVLKKIELGIKDPVTQDLTSINENVAITPNEINLNIVFNPVDLENIQYMEFFFRLNYSDTKVSEIIDSQTFLYFYAYDTSFEVPFFTKNINFRNDYDKIIALQAPEDFWQANYQFPKSFNEKRSTEFMEKNSFLINYDNAIASEDLKFTDPSVISWNKDKRLEWEYIKTEMTVNDDQKGILDRNYDSEMKADKVYHSSSEVLSDKFDSQDTNEFNFSYMLDVYTDENGERRMVSRTLFDRSSSFYRYDRTKNKLVYFNLLFDIFEVYRRDATSQITDTMTFEKMKEVFEKTFKEAILTAKKLSLETNDGQNYQNLVGWNNKLKSRLNIDNFSIINKL